MFDDILFVGVDPGKTGFFTMFFNGEHTHHQVPIKNEELDSFKLFNILEYYLYKEDIRKIIVFIEDIHSIHGMSAKSNFSYGEVYGGIKACIACTYGDFFLVQPKSWQKLMHQGIEFNDDKKVMSLEAAKKLFPDKTFLRTTRCTTPDHNLVDSLLICEYAKLKYHELRNS